MAENKEFKVNDFITLKLENEKTQIYINNNIFIQCKFLILDISIEKIGIINEMDSIDEIAETIDKSLEFDNNKENLEITSEDEFWAHCSNLQAWVENNYDTRLLHRNLAFPLLKALSDAGDKLANLKFKEEIAMRYKYGNYTMQAFLFEQKYLSYLAYDERFNGILEPEDALFMEKIKASGYYRFIPCFDLIRDLPQIDSLFLSIDQGKIKELHIKLGENLTVIPKEIKYLTSLNYLIIEIAGPCDNIFEELAQLELKSVTNLKIFCSFPINIPDSLGNFPNLKRLRIRGIDCKPRIKLDKSFTKLKELEFLDLDNINLNYFPDTIANLKKLRIFEITAMPIKEIPTQYLLKTPIKTLKINYCPLLNLNTLEIKKLKEEINILSLIGIGATNMK